MQTKKFKVKNLIITDTKSFKILKKKFKKTSYEPFYDFKAEMYSEDYENFEN